MTEKRRTSRNALGLALGLAFAAAAGLYLWLGEKRPATIVMHPLSPSPRATHRTISAAAQATPSAPLQFAARSPTATRISAAAPPRVVDLGALSGAPPPAATEAQDEFPTNERFTREDLQHPERYFAQAATMPELNRAEERHDALDFFVAYRSKLERDLATAASPSQRAELMEVIERYDQAIQQMRQLLQSPAPQ